jgi:cyclomaltodextrinase
MTVTDGPGLASRLGHLMTTYPPEITAVQLNLLGSHDMPRILSICGGDRAAVRLATLLTMTVPGAPCIYYGDEIGLAGEHDPGCRGSFPVDETTWDRDLLAFFRAAIALRAGHVALRRGTFAVAGAEGQAIAWRRDAGGQSVLIALNAGLGVARLECDLADLEGRRLVALAPAGWPWPSGGPVTVTGGRVELELPGRGALVMHTSDG